LVWSSFLPDTDLSAYWQALKCTMHAVWRGRLAGLFS
jgi:hypothetical protein